MSEAGFYSRQSAVWGVLLALFIQVPGMAAAQAASPERASLAIPSQRLQQYSDLSVQWMREYLRIDTTNPPGNEMRAAAFFKKTLDQEGIQHQVFKYLPESAALCA